MNRTGRVWRLNELLSAEQSALETYDHALGKRGKGVKLDKLREVQHGHQLAATELQSRVETLGGEPSGGNVWPEWSEAVHIREPLLGESVILDALRDGEKTGVRCYEAALLDQTLSVEDRELIERVLLPRQRDHVAYLKSMLESI